MSLNSLFVVENKRKAFLYYVICLFFVALAVPKLAFSGIADTPLPGGRCPDWSFHVCFAESLDAHACNEGYSDYPAFIHLGAFETKIALGLPVEWYFVGVLTLCFLAIAIGLIWKGGFAAFLAYFFGLPVLMFLAGKTLYTWFDVVYCGLVPFVFVATTFFLLLVDWKHLGVYGVALASFGFLAHSQGFYLLALFVFSWLLAKVVGERLAGDFLTAQAVICLVMVTFGMAFWPDVAARARLSFFFYLLVSLVVGRVLFVNSLTKGEMAWEK